LLAPALALVLAVQPVAASVSYTSVVKLGRTESFVSSTSAIARTATSTKSRLHVVYTSKNVDGVDDQDGGPFTGIYTRRSSTGATWTTPKRLNSSTEHGDLAAAASSGKRLYVVWRTQTHIEDYENYADPYLVKFRANDDQGSSTTWRSTKSLTTSGRVDRPMIAASGSAVYVVWTERGTGEIELVKSTDYGKTWSLPQAVGATVDVPYPTYGYAGYPVVAVTGSTVAIAYTSDDQIVAKVSTNGGSSFGAPEIRDATEPGISITARSGRVALAYADHTGVYARVRTSGGWQAWRKGASYPNSLYSQPFDFGVGSLADAPDVVLYSTGGIGLAFTSCTSTCLSDTGSRATLRWRQSTNNGSTWGKVVAVASGAVTNQRRYNWAPSALMIGSTTRHVVWSGWSAAGTQFVRAPYYRAVTGTP
jgi:hypothetical protein